MNQSKVNIRPVEAAEHQDILMLWEDSVRASHDFITEADIDEYRLRISSSLPNLTVFCIEAEGLIQGFIALSDHKIQLLFVHPRAFRKGFGKRLIAFGIEKHKAWLVDVNAQNQNALSFYLSLGFKVYHKFANDGAGKPYPVWSLRLNRMYRNKQQWREFRKKLSTFFKS